MIAAGPLAVRIAATALLSPTLKRLTLELADGGLLPPAQAGAHAVLSWQAAGRTIRRSYSLAALPDHRRHVQVIVRRVAQSRGGSAFLHDTLRDGDVLGMGLPQNLFPIPRRASRHVLLAGGVGVTPFLAWLPALARTRIPVRLHQFCRPDEKAAFAALLAGHAADTVFHAGPDRPGFATLLAGLPLGTHVSVCGPRAFMDEAQRTALACGLPPAKIHREEFGAAAPGAAFVAVLAGSLRRIAVDPDVSLLEALEQAGLEPPSLCRGGVCGQCRVRVLAGVPDHRDHVLSPAERARGDAIMTCVSRALGDELVLEL